MELLLQINYTIIELLLQLKCPVIELSPAQIENDRLDWTRLNFTTKSCHRDVFVTRMYCPRVVVTDKMSSHKTATSLD